LRARKAVKWYRLAADQGDADAQSSLGAMYYQGQGVPQDYVCAHMWFDLAAAHGEKDAAKKRDTVAQRMTEQIAEAQKLARGFMIFTITPNHPRSSAALGLDDRQCLSYCRRLRSWQRG